MKAFFQMGYKKAAITIGPSWLTISILLMAMYTPDENWLNKSLLGSQKMADGNG